MATRKKRIRKHVIADLSVNHVDFHLLNAGHTMAVDPKDYGYDGNITTFSPTGEVENGYAFIQLKATDHLVAKVKAKGTEFSFSISKKDIDFWHDEVFPVYLLLYDAINMKGYWLYLQQYFEIKKITPASIKGKSLTVRIDAANLFDSNTPDLWRNHKNKIISLIKANGNITHV